jgi:hypothetical protein
MTLDLLVDAIVPIAVIVLMTAVGLNLTLTSLRTILKHPRSLLLSTLFQILVLPLAALSLIFLLSPPPLIAIVMFALAISPGGALSNGFTHLAGGNLVLSVMMTIVTTRLVIFTADDVARTATDMPRSVTSVTASTRGSRQNCRRSPGPVPWSSERPPEPWSERRRPMGPFCLTGGSNSSRREVSCGQDLKTDVEQVSALLTCPTLSPSPGPGRRR